METRYCRKCKDDHPFEQDGCESWPAVLPKDRPNQTILNLGVGRKPRASKATRTVYLVGRGEL
jgi:hypothetical protein